MAQRFMFGFLFSKLIGGTALLSLTATPTKEHYLVHGSQSLLSNIQPCSGFINATALIWQPDISCTSTPGRWLAAVPSALSLRPPSDLRDWTRQSNQDASPQFWPKHPTLLTQGQVGNPNSIQ